MSITQTVKSKYADIKRTLKEQGRLDRAKAVEREREKVFEDVERIKASKEREELARARAKREAAKAVQSEKEREAERELELERSRIKEEKARLKAEFNTHLAEQRAREREARTQAFQASQERAKASAALRHEKLHQFKESVTSHPLFKPIELGGTALRTIARPQITKFYTLGSHPATHSPSYNALMNAFENAPFTAEQAATVVSSALGVDYEDAYNRLRLMKSRGYIHEGV